MAQRLFFSRVVVDTSGPFPFRVAEIARLARSRALGTYADTITELGSTGWALVCLDVADGEAAALAGLVPEALEVPVDRDGAGRITWARRLADINPLARDRFLAFLATELNFDPSALGNETNLVELLDAVGVGLNGASFDARHARAFGLTEPPDQLGGEP